MCIFHKWGKWTQYESTAIQNLYGMRYLATKVHQTRTCHRCGFSQDEWLSSKDAVKLKESEIDRGDVTYTSKNPLIVCDEKH